MTRYDDDDDCPDDTALWPEELMHTKPHRYENKKLTNHQHK
jgi:hypothetical protein